MDETSIWAWACVGLGVYLTIYALLSLRRGATQGYYRDHRHARGQPGTRFDLWVWFRLLLGVGCLSAGLLLL